MKSHKEYQISFQVVQAGTSRRATVRRAEFAKSRKDFVHKLCIGLKDANETGYWLKRLHNTGNINKKMFDSLKKDSREILKMLLCRVKMIKRSL